MYYDNYVYMLLYCLIITILIEVGFALILGLRKKDLVNVILVNVLTNPLFNSIHPLIMFKWGDDAQIYSILILEVLIVIGEGAIYSKVLKNNKINAYAISLILNVLSFVLGTFINYNLFM